MQHKSDINGYHNIRGSFVSSDGDDYYMIENVHRMDEFLMTLVSDSDHWMFISSRGALTAGRNNPDNALFPYDTVDRVYTGRNRTGVKTAFRMNCKGKDYLWVPWSDISLQLYGVRRNLLKNETGCEIIFEEVNPILGLTFCYSWSFSRNFGFIKKARIRNLTNIKTDICMVDGLSNMINPGITRLLLNEFSCLTDAYKYNVIHPCGLGVFNLASCITDKAEPREALRATICWQYGLDADKIYIDGKAFSEFLAGRDYTENRVSKGRQSDFFIHSIFTLSPDTEKSWYLVTDINRTQVQVDDLVHLIEHGKKSELLHLIENERRKTRDRLKGIIGRADGHQWTGDRRYSLHHYANTLFNVMRGGVFLNNYHINIPDFIIFLKERNTGLYSAYGESLIAFGQNKEKESLFEWACNKHKSLARLVLEYLPLQFSRRHGDPSRPWNTFSITIEDKNHRPVLDYQGNWRDTFQNWEALGISFPGYYRNFIAKFLNAITPDGYNPYRISRQGFEWEVVVPGNPWSNIGYWKDHQIIYVQKFFEWEELFFPGQLDNDLSKEVYSYANVPYRIRSYESILEDPQKTIDFDYQCHDTIVKKIPGFGTDAKLVFAGSQVYHASLLEKILILLLVKISNVIPDGGIWLNTQRPEWNDANNALAGFGLSMVTLYYLKRFAGFWMKKLEARCNEESMIASGIIDFADSLYKILTRFKSCLTGGFDSRSRKAFMDAMGAAAGLYRQKIYSQQGFSTKKVYSFKKIVDLFSLSLAYLGKSIDHNKGADGLYHSYNLLCLNPEKTKADVQHLYPMLEGQVAVISSGALTSRQVLQLLRTLKNGPLYRHDQNSYILYPDKELPDFFKKNHPDPEELLANPLISLMLEKKDHRIIDRSGRGLYTFQADISNKDDLMLVFKELEKDNIYAHLAVQEKQRVLELYEKEFHHREFTGRSSGMFAYEGLGSIYWHMVSKLLLAVQECFLKARRNEDDPAVVQGLKDAYLDIRTGLGYLKSPDMYGAFPADPYSHTPAFAGAQQPGMTGQVKEEIITRFGELGVHLEQGCLFFDPHLIMPGEWATEKGTFHYYDHSGEACSLTIKPGQLAFTFCQVPVVYEKGEKAAITVVYVDGSEKNFDRCLDRKTTLSIIERRGEIREVFVYIKRSHFTVKETLTSSFPVSGSLIRMS